MIKPTIGRVVWYNPSAVDDVVKQGQLHRADVCHVHSDSCVNLSINDSVGTPYSRTSVPLVQGDEIPKGSCGWMPYQKQAAEKDKQA